ncbi:ribulose-phosphate 3-epimerase [Herbinix hemicellulosilytica]|uniref:Ribulose-phosphate 3-epimerase n=1 Tax=Herbinix hemicellulosilytica TaxID=1564487 RepID=A0A0H5SGN1_HERHM|nr:ribulose-phosphate 3-epimerase [Herbinix hemicellulosilytica]RBP56783.1 ribulose-phosphate 3-epimerase [Herbinix hemicellulosilytica]CRZ34657.1 Ribulose-phosphate 3-epimerase [Herbinix hemicellulosilytica]
MIKLAPSILAADFNVLGKQIKTVEEAGVPYLHIDVMDGNFVPNISFGIPVISSIREKSNLIFDVHLMVNEPERLLEDFKKAGADIITVHAEACTHLHNTIHKIKKLGLKAGVSLNPATGLNVLDYIINDIDMVLIMSVNPGFGGQAFIPSSLDKIRDLKEKAQKAGANIDIEVDGGITPDNVADVLEAGANVIVSGTSIFEGDIAANINRYYEVFRKFEQQHK